MIDLGADSGLVRLCIKSACESKETVERWKRQSRSLGRLPFPLADALLRHLLRNRLLYPSLLGVFKLSVEDVDLRGENTVDAEWMAYLGSFRFLRSLNLADCHRINNNALWNLTGMTSLKEIDLSRCLKVNNAGVRHLITIPSLEKLHISGTSVTADGVKLISALTNLSILDLGGLPVTDTALESLLGLTKLEYLDLWGSEVTNEGATILENFPKLSFLNLAWTGVTRLPNASSLQSLNLSNCCKIEFVVEGDGSKAPIAKLMLAGATFANEAEAFLYLESSSLSYLDLSNSSLERLSFLLHMKALEHLDLNSSSIGDAALEDVVCIGANLIFLNLSQTMVTSSGVAILAGHVPKLEWMSLSHTLIDDFALSDIGMMASLKNVDLSYTVIKGYFHLVDREEHSVSSLAALHNLSRLESLNLEGTQVMDAALMPLSNFPELRYVSLRSTSLTDISLHHFSSLSKLTYLGICDAVLTDGGLDLFRPPESLKVLDLKGCWLLTEDAITSFYKRHPSIEVRHEILSVSSPDQQRLKESSRHSQTNKKRAKMLVPLPIPRYFIDQRIKYSREELLALQYQSLSCGSTSESSSSTAQ